MALLQNGGEALSESQPARLRPAAGPRCGPTTTATACPTCCWPRRPGPKLYTNLGDGQFRDDSHLLPREPGYNLTAAAWIDYDGDGKPDILLGNGFHGLRLYRNKGPVDIKMTPLLLGKWHYIGPFANSRNQGFDTAYPPEKEIDLKKKYAGEAVNRSTGKKANSSTARSTILPCSIRNTTSTASSISIARLTAERRRSCRFRSAATMP